MSFPSHLAGGAPTYVRQNSYETQSSGRGASPNHQYPYAPHPPLPQARFAGPSNPVPQQGPVQRKQTVRGAVRGTIREAGTNTRLAATPSRALTRGKTLTRPDRFVAPAPLINPPGAMGGAVQTTLVNGVPTLTTKESNWDPWSIFVNVVTFYAPRRLLTSVGLTDRAKQRAWKEKVALCTIAVFLMGVVGFVTIGLTRVLCPSEGPRSTSAFTRLGSQPGFVGIEGWNFQVTTGRSPPAFIDVANDLSGSDVSDYFDRSDASFPQCAGITARYATTNLCSTSATAASCSLDAPTTSLFNSLGLTNSTQLVGYAWEQLDEIPNFMIIDGNVLNLTPYILANPNPIANDTVDTAIRYVLQIMDGTGGKDATRLFYNRNGLKDAIPCLVERYYAGQIDKISPGCFISQLFLYVSLVLIMGIVLARFFMALIFSWFLSARMVKPPKNLKRPVISPAVMPEGANIDVNNTTGAAPWTEQAVKRQRTQRLRRGAGPGAANGKGAEEYAEKEMGGASEAVGPDGMISMASIGAELFCVCLVTCYSEGEEGIRTTLDSIAGTTYSDARKLLFIVCDGMITGHGEKKSTPDICVGMIEADARFREPQAMSYVAIGDGSKAHNQAMVYAGHYTNVKGHRTPTIIVVKCGLPEEAKEGKPGNRGKRDSQMVLMNFFSRVTYNDRMCPLDYDLFRKVQSLMGVTPDFFEVCLMVDADTKVYPDSLGYLVRVMQNDNLVMGVCGETRIANKRQSWVTCIQVFEYFISHHLSKGFESVFGGVTCLPGCFSMYRLKARKQNDGDWFPVLVQPQIVSEYSQSIVTTLHQKNLLLLGEDRFLTTLLLRTFPNRKMMFCPQARCRTVAPDTFAVLLSQRRRWINSTIHNLMELVLVRNLCGTFCFSMQFIIFIDLIGTVVLPAAICLTYTLIINYIFFNPPANFSDAIPLLLLFAVLGLPGVLILMTTFKIVYVGWMLVYLIALPIWNLVLPLYAFSKFDDFSWGETRKVAGEVKGDDGHGGAGGVAQNVPLRRWEDWERSRLRKIKRDQKRRKEFERTFGSKHFYGAETREGGSAYSESVAPSDSVSMMSRDDDRWGMQIGAYSEDGPTEEPPPVGLYTVDDTESEAHETIDAHDLERALEQGWGDEPQYPQDGLGRQYGGGQRTSNGYGASNDSHYAAPTPSAPLVAPRLYSLTDEPLRDSSYSISSNPFNSTTSLGGDSSYGHEPFSPNGSSYPIVPSVYTNDSRNPLVQGSRPGPGTTTGFERSTSGGHAKQRSREEQGMGIERDGMTPSPSRDQQWDQQQQGRRLA